MFFMMEDSMCKLFGDGVIGFKEIILLLLNYYLLMRFKWKVNRVF